MTRTFLSPRLKAAALVAGSISALVIGLTCSTAGVAFADSIPPNCQPTTVLAVGAPEGDPLTMSANELRLAGYPPRPVAESDAFASWSSAVSAVQSFSTPDPVCGGADHAVVSSQIASGHVVSNSDFGGVHFTSVSSTWVQPSVPGNSLYTNYQTAPAVSLWTGIGISSLIQAGVDSIATATPQYRFWTQDFPQGVIWEGPVIHPGDSVYVYVEYLGNSQSYFYLENVTTGFAQAFTNATPYVGYNAVNFMLERSNGLYLPKFATTSVVNNFFGAGNSAWPLTTLNDRYVMVNSCGTTLSSASSVANDSSFTQTWLNSGASC